MSDDEPVENLDSKVESFGTPKISDSTELMNTTENQQIWNTANSIHILDNGESATHLALS